MASKARVKDRISGLSDEVLCRMLSFLPTKYAVRTSILSTRWNNLWASVPNLDFKCKVESDSVGFMTFVDRVLYFRDSSDIQKFRLHCSFIEDFSRIEGWIRTAIRRNAAELDLRVSLINGNPRFELPKTLFMCKTLVVLKVKSNCITYNPPTSGCFPNLKFLSVIAAFPDNDSMEKLFSCCPVLEDLTIYARLVGFGWNFKVSAPQLKTLRITLLSLTGFGVPDNRSNIFISAPKLEILHLKQYILSNYFWANAKSLVRANIDLYGHGPYKYCNFSEGATTLLAGISNVKYLSLSAHSLKDYCLPAFDNLSELKLVLHDCYCWKLLTGLLERSPNLECLVLEHKEDKACLGDGSTFENRWNAPVSVPVCLVSQLKIITISGFKGYPDEKKMSKYLLENGKVLTKMTIHTDLCKEFSMLQKGSRACQFELL